MAFVEIPALYLDEVVLDATSTGIALINLSPDSGAIGVLVNSNISVDIADLSGVGLDAAETNIFIDINGAGEVLAFSAGTFQPGWNGTESAVSAPDADTTRIVIDPVNPLSSLDAVTIRVVAETVAAASTINQSYGITVQDITAPAVSGVTARDLNVIRIAFDEPVKQVNADDADDALNPANYDFTPEAASIPAVHAVGLSVESVSSNTVDVTTDIELSMNKLYKLTVSNVADLDGNPIQ